ncbi:MAG: SDR family NAD(P)-dependent oxidoreductase, partial [Bacteroidota bacterium]|nr:SDR family NAD(P)-dependent oxidoreductase [Bacteroidota bacterium]
MKVNELFNLNGKTAVVTGASRGIGQAMAVALAEAGADIIDVSMQPESETKKRVETTGKKYWSYAADFSDRSLLYQFIETVKKEHKQIDILINNAGTILRNPVAEHSDEEWDKVISINLNAQFILTRELGKEMIKRGNGKIVFTCSLLSFQGGIN